MSYSHGGISCPWVLSPAQFGGPLEKLLPAASLPVWLSRTTFEILKKAHATGTKTIFLGIKEERACRTTWGVLLLPAVPWPEINHKPWPTHRGRFGNCSLAMCQQEKRSIVMSLPQQLFQLDDQFTEHQHFRGCCLRNTICTQSAKQTRQKRNYKDSSSL